MAMHSVRRMLRRMSFQRTAARRQPPAPLPTNGRVSSSLPDFVPVDGGKPEPAAAQPSLADSMRPHGRGDSGAVA